MNTDFTTLHLLRKELSVLIVEMAAAEGGSFVSPVYNRGGKLNDWSDIRIERRSRAKITNEFCGKNNLPFASYKDNLEPEELVELIFINSL